MKIAIYANELTLPGNRGVKTYSLEIINSLLQTDGENEYVLHSSKDISGQIHSGNAKFAVYKPGWKFWAFSAFAPRVMQDKPDAVFMPIQTFPFFNLRKNKPKIVVTVHDLAFLYFPQQFTPIKRMLLEWHTRRAVELADAVIVPSESTKKDILSSYKRADADKITAIPHGYKESLLALSETGDERVMKATGGHPYILFVGAIQPRKNLVRLAEAFARLKEDNSFKNLKLVLCGPDGWMFEDIHAQIDKNAFRKDIISTGGVSDDLLAGFYRNAECFILPSLYEGFGLPVLEAMSFGLPVIVGNNSSLAEIVGDSGLLVDEKDPEDIKSKLKMLLSSQNMKAELSRKSLERAKAFGWDKAATETCKIFERDA